MRDLPWNLRATTAPLGIAGRVSDAKQIRDAGGIRLHICPATGNLPTRRTRAAWDVLFAATQRKARERECIDKNQAQLMRMTRRLDVCAWCLGKILPRGLEFIDAAEMAAMIKPQEEAMAKQSKIGVCENCGDRGALTGSFGRRVCSTCLKIRSNVNSHLEKVATAARDMGRAPELLAALVPDGGGLAIKVTADLLQEISGIVGYDGEDPDELVAAVRKGTALGAHQLTSEAEAGALRTIAGIVGYEGTDGEQLVEAVRKQVLTCASCEAEDVLHEIRDIVGYALDQGDKGRADAVRAFKGRADAVRAFKGLADAVRAFADRRPADVQDGSECAAVDALLEVAELVNKRGANPGFVVGAVRALVNQPWPPSGSDQHRADLLRACGLELDDAVSASSRMGWSWAAAAAVQTIGELTDRRDHLLELVTKERADNVQLREQVAVLNGATRGESEDDTRLRDELARAGAEVEQLRNRAQESESRLIWYREALAVLRDRLGLDHLGEDEDVVERMLEAIASQAQALTRFQDLSRAADVRADHLEGELERQIGVNEAQSAVERELRATIAEQSADFERLRNQDLAGNGRYWSTDDSPLLDVALAVIRDEPVPADRIATLIDLARRASA